MRRIETAIRMFMACACVTVALGADTAKKGSALLLKDGFPPISAEEKALVSVPYAPEATAVVLLEAEHHDVIKPPDATSQQEADLQATQQTREEELLGVRPKFDPRERLKYWRRVKVLRAEGAQEAARWTREFAGPFRIEEAAARVVLGDGRVLDVSGEIVRVPATGTAARGERCRIEVSFPNVESGAILDLYLSGFRDELPSMVWAPRDVIPVLDSRLAIEGPTGLVFGSLGVGLSDAEKAPDSFRVNRGTAHVWRWTNLPPSGVEPLAPRGRAASTSLIVAMRALRDGNYRYEWTVEWKPWAQRERKEGWDAWFLRKSHASEAAAVAAVGDRVDPLEKAAAIGALIRSRMRSVEGMYARSKDSADDCLASAAGTASEVAGLAVVMLRKVGVTADLVVFRDAQSGPLPLQGPLPVLLDRAAVRIAGPQGPVYFDPMSTAPLGPVPPTLRGVSVFPLDGVAEAPISLPGAIAADRRVMRFVRGRLDTAGALAAEGTFTYHAAAADELRGRLRVADEAARLQIVSTALAVRRPVSDVEIAAIEGLDGDKELVVKARWSTPGFATNRDGKLQFDPRLFRALAQADWASETRREDIDFGAPFDEQDVVSVTLPEGFSVPAPPPPFTGNAPPVGSYTTSVSAGGTVVSLRRQFRIDTARIPASAWNGLKPWLRDVARADSTQIEATSK